SGEFPVGGAFQVWLGRRLWIAVRSDAVDAAVADRFVEPALEDLLSQEGGDENLVLQNAAVHIDDVEVSVGPVGRLDRTKTFIGGAEKFDALPFRVRFQAVLSEDFDALIEEAETSYDIASRFRNEGVAGKLAGELVAAINGRAAS